MRNVQHIEAKDDPSPADPLEPLEELFRDLRVSAAGLSSREAARRLEVSGPNEFVRRGGRRWPGELARQFTHPLALLLAAAAVLAWASGTPRLGVAIVAVILLNASFSFVQELQAERAVEALAAFLPERAWVLRDGSRQEIEARLLVPGDVLLIEEGERICADARLMTGTLEVDMSTLTGESVPVIRSAETLDGKVPLLQARDLVFSGSECTGGEAQAVVTATGMGTELGRIAALSQRVGREESPLEHQVKRAARLIAFVAVGAGLAFLPIGLAAGLSLAAAISFAIGLLVANVPEGLLPTITLALAVGVREMGKSGCSPTSSCWPRSRSRWPSPPPWSTCPPCRACSAQLRFHPASSLSWRPSRSLSGAPTRSGGRWSAGGPSCEVAGDPTFSPPEPDQRPYLFVTAGEEAGR